MQKTAIRITLILVAALLVVFLLWYFITRVVMKPSSFEINVNRPAVIKQIRSLARLETASYTIEKVIDGHTNNSNAVTQFLFGDKILLVAHGQVIAGFDLSQISDKDVEIKGKEITLRLPAPQVLVATLDNSQTKVYDRTQGILRHNDTELETAVRQSAEESVRQAACEGNILQTASDNAKRQLTSLLSGFGFENVRVEIPQGTCK